MLRKMMQMIERPSCHSQYLHGPSSSLYQNGRAAEGVLSSSVVLTLLSPPSYTARAVTNDSLLLKALRSMKF